ncbi:MAG: response regulator [Anaerolineae bacterium]|nr:response regulator [Anaerolineae bacterium]
MAHILIIDDDQDILRLLEFSFKRSGHSVSISSNGEQGLAQAEIENPDLIICDVMMPKMTGYDFCRQARTKPDLKDTPIVIFSARFQPIDRQTALDAGATDYLAKTVAPDELVGRIEELLPTATPPTLGGTVGLFSMKGGTGVTSLAVNLAIALTLAHKAGAVLADLALVGGHSALMLGVRPTSSLPKLLSTGEPQFTTEMVQPYLVKHSSGVQLLASLPAFSEAVAPPDRLESLVQCLKSSFDFTVLDLSHLLEPQFSALLPLLDKIVLVLSPDMPSVQSTVIALQGLAQLGADDQKISLVVNQITPRHSLPLQTIQKVIKRPITLAVPFEPEMIRAVNSGKPLLLASPQTPAASAIGKLADTLFK